MTSNRQKLIEKAQVMMKNSLDPVHDLGHVTRVANYTNLLTQDLNISAEERSALELAAWWHDAARTITKNPSIVWMPLFDDIISAFMLWWETVRNGLYGASAGLAIRIIFCKSIGTGAVLTRILVRKRRRILVDMLKDADNLDVLNQERTKKLMVMAESSWIYHHGYKVMFVWFLKSSELKMKTAEARKYIEKVLRAFIEWMKQGEILAWHIKQFGKKWADKTIRLGERLLNQIVLLNEVQLA